MTENKVEIKKDKSGISMAATGYVSFGVILCVALYLMSAVLPSKVEQIARQKAAEEITEAVTEATPKSNPVVLALAIKELTREVSRLREDMERRDDELRMEFRQMERQIDPACRDGTKEEVRSVHKMKSSVSPNPLPDHLNFYGQQEVARDRLYNIYWTEPKDYEWLFKSCKAKRNDYLG